MTKKLSRAVDIVVGSCMKLNAVRKATVYISKNLVVKAARRHKHRKGVIDEFVLCIGKPNYEERNYIKRSKKNRWAVPWGKDQYFLKFYPKANNNLG